MEDIEIPTYFICPISLQIMKDPVTAITGITYDRESIEQWLLTAEDAACPVTKQLLPRDSDMTPNHTLRRLIQAWCIANANYGIDRIPTPKSPLSVSHVLKLHRQLNIPELSLSALKAMDVLANESEKNRKCMAEAGTAKAMVSLIVKCFKEHRMLGLEEAFRILHLTWKQSLENIHMVKENFDLTDSILWILQVENIDDKTNVVVKNFTILILKTIIEVASSSLLERLQNNFFYVTVKMLRDDHISEQARKAMLHVLIDLCPWARNRIRIVKAGAVFELIELELGHPGKHVTELIFCLLSHLCACADGRAQLVKHAVGIALVSKRILRVSPGTDDRAVHVLAMIARHSATDEVLGEMLKVGAVAKLCMVIQADCQDYLKKKAREILRLNCQKAAMRSLRLARNHSSSEYERLVYEGWILYDTGHREEALSKAEKSISIQRSFEAFFLKAYTLADTTLDPDTSSYVIQLLKDALGCPSDGLRKGQALNNLGSIYVDCGKLDLAADCYINALDIKHTRAHQGLARVYYLKNEKKAAFEEMTKLIDKAPNSASAYEKRSEYGERDMASNDLSTATQLDPLRTYPYRYRAAVLMDDQREFEAVAELNKAISFKPDLQMLHLRSAFHESMGDVVTALIDCEAALCLDPNHKDTLDLYSRTRGESNHQQK